MNYKRETAHRQYFLFLIWIVKQNNGIITSIPSQSSELNPMATASNNYGNNTPSWILWRQKVSMMEIKLDPLSTAGKHDNTRETSGNHSIVNIALPQLYDSDPLATMSSHDDLAANYMSSQLNEASSGESQNDAGWMQTMLRVVNNSISGSRLHIRKINKQQLLKHLRKQKQTKVNNNKLNRNLVAIGQPRTKNRLWLVNTVIA